MNLKSVKNCRKNCQEIKNQKHTNRFFTGKTSFEKCDESMNLEKIRQFLFQLQMNEEEFFAAAIWC